MACGVRVCVVWQNRPTVKQLLRSPVLQARINHFLTHTLAIPREFGSALPIAAAASPAAAAAAPPAAAVPSRGPEPVVAVVKAAAVAGSVRLCLCAAGGPLQALPDPVLVANRLAFVWVIDVGWLRRA